MNAYESFIDQALDSTSRISLQQNISRKKRFYRSLSNLFISFAIGCSFYSILGWTIIWSIATLFGFIGVLFLVGSNKADNKLTILSILDRIK